MQKKSSITIMPPTSSSGVTKSEGKSLNELPVSSLITKNNLTSSDNVNLVNCDESTLSGDLDRNSIQQMQNIKPNKITNNMDETGENFSSLKSHELDNVKQTYPHPNIIAGDTLMSDRNTSNHLHEDHTIVMIQKMDEGPKKANVKQNEKTDCSACVNLSNECIKTCDRNDARKDQKDLKCRQNKEELIEDTENLSVPGGTINNEEPECFFCGKRSSKEIVLELCQYCKDVYYCGPTHFEYHRPESQCYPYIIKHAPGVGRFMVASRDINPLELILKEFPAVVGPYTNTLQGCLQCFRKIDGGYKCTGCGFPMCNAKCESGPLHREECQFFQEQHHGENQNMCFKGLGAAIKPNKITVNDKSLNAKQLFASKRIPLEASALAAASLEGSNVNPTINNDISNEDDNPECNNSDGLISTDTNTQVSKKFRKQIPAMLRSSSSHVCITPLRMLLKRNTDPKANEKINMLKDHLEERNDKYQNVGIQMLNVVMLLQEACSKPQFTNQEIQRMIGILRTNGMKLLPHGTKAGIQGVALYPIYCLINHACINNTNYVKYPDYHLEVRSQLPIKKGEEIYTRYISSTIGNFRRREDIRKYWFFDCTCNRCADRTEFGTNMSAVLCLKCKKGYLLPLDPLEYKSDWTCDHCQTKTKYEMIDEIITTIEDEVGELTQSSKSISDMERMLHCFSSVLHPSHYILIDIMHNLVHLYAAKKTLSRPEKERKIQLCFNVIDILGVVDPGYTKWRGTLLQELIHPLMQITKRDHDLEIISPQEFQRRLHFCTRNLNAAKKCIRGGFTPIEDFIRQQKSDVKWETEDFVNAIGNIGIAHKVNMLD